jgi:ribose 5-phosphate isomerase A
VPLELLAFGLRATLAAVAPATVRAGMPRSPDGNVIVDYTGPIDDPSTLAAFLSSVPGVVDHGLFPPAMTAEVIVAGPDGVQRREIFNV